MRGMRISTYLIVLIWLVVFLMGQAFAGSLTFIDPSVSISTNLHFSGKFCSECHNAEPRENVDQALRFGVDFTATCKCHGYSAGTYIHPVDIIPSPAKKIRIPAEMPLKDGKITCATCHDIYLQCRDDNVAKQENRAFLRGAPYRTRTGLCVRCHEQGKYKMFDPHNQLDHDGQIIEEKCLYCHVELPDANQGTFRSSGIHSKTVKLIGDLTVLCHRCHFKQSRLHPINADHFRVPSARILKNMLQNEEVLGMLLPLDYEGKVSCPTCHNPHERGVIPVERAAAKGADEKYRLRVPGQAGQMCRACHNK